VSCEIHGLASSRHSVAFLSEPSVNLVDVKWAALFRQYLSHMSDDRVVNKRALPGGWDFVAPRSPLRFKIE
jgi:hypothetical protein